VPGPALYQLVPTEVRGDKIAIAVPSNFRVGGPAPRVVARRTQAGAKGRDYWRNHQTRGLVSLGWVAVNRSRAIRFSKAEVK